MRSDTSKRAIPVLLSALAALSLCGLPARGDIPRDPAFLEKVDKAITKGSDWLQTAWRQEAEHPAASG